MFRKTRVVGRDFSLSEDDRAIEWNSRGDEQLIIYSKTRKRRKRYTEFIFAE